MTKRITWLLGLAGVFFVLSLVYSSAQSSGFSFVLPHGVFRSIYDNEIELVSTKSDPPKVRLAVDASMVESNLGSFSMNTRRGDGSGTHDEMAYVMGRLTASKTEGALYFATRSADDEQPRERFYLGPREAIFSVPVFAPNLNGSSSGPSNFVESPNGCYRTQQQDDGNLVTYDKCVVPWKAVWSAWTGRIR